ncbi:MAG: DUF86 domain-containing protein [Oscillospiraceae bacterium]|nr:DUF86 domain-containing protein [Oscillospiraceae bacterium]
MIKDSDRDIFIIRRILTYCNEVDEVIRLCRNSFETFDTVFLFRNSASMSIQSIGELVKHLSDEFKQAHSNIPWSQIRGMRHRFAHDYYEMNHEIIWSVAVDDIPELRKFCEEILKDLP